MASEVHFMHCMPFILATTMEHMLIQKLLVEEFMNDLNDLVCTETRYRTGILIVSKCPFEKYFNMYNGYGQHHICGIS